MRTVIFDLDGTLADTSRDLIAAANACFRAMGHGDVLDPVADAGVAFRGGRAMLSAGLARVNGGGDGETDEALIASNYPLLLDSYESWIDRETRLYPGAMEAVGALRGAGYAVGICTNKPARLADLLMTKLGVRDAFASLVGADTLPVRKPDPAPYLAAVDRAGGQVTHSLLVGDTVTDRETARAAGVPCILVTFGPDGMGVADLAPEALIGHFDELPSAVARLIG
jgi:phosphoglycolate phosphatase